MSNVPGAREVIAVTRRVLGTTIVLAAFGVLVMAMVLALDARSERDAARARVTGLQATITLLRRQIDSATKSIGELHGQVEWDKSHLLDCWTAIVRALPEDTIPADARTSMWAVRSGYPLDHYVSSCASDAVP